MAKPDPQALCEQLFTTFLAPLVLGGTMRLTKAIGGKNALLLGDGRSPSDQERLSRTLLARVRVARKLAPIDRFEPEPSGAEWALAAALHDLVQAAHPGFNAVFRKNSPSRILSIIDETLARIPPPRTVGEALSRHTWLSRMFELTRTDVEVKWWTGSETFLGEDPPARLTAWPELRRVHQTRIPRALMDLPASGGAVDVARFTSAVSGILSRTPLTDLATIDRKAPPFAWRHDTLAMCATNAGRTLVLRALAHLPERRVDAALGNATRELAAQKAVHALGFALDLLRDRALAAAAARIARDREPHPIVLGLANDDAAFAVSAGARAASRWLTQTGGGFPEAERAALLRVLAPAGSSATESDARLIAAEAHHP